MPPNLLDLTDFFLNLAGYLFNGTFSFQLWIVAYFPGILLRPYPSLRETCLLLCLDCSIS